MLGGYCPIPGLDQERAIERFEYPVRLSPDSGGGFSVSCRDFPQLVARGDDTALALSAAAAAFAGIFADYTRADLRLPRASPAREGERLISAPAEAMAKAALHAAMKNAGFTKTELARRLGVDEKEVRRLLDPHYGSKLPRLAEAIGVLGCRLVIGLEAA